MLHLCSAETKPLNFRPAATWAPHHLLAGAQRSAHMESSTKARTWLLPRRVGRSPPLVTGELGARDFSMCRLGVGAKPRLGQWPPASARPPGHAGRARRERNGMPHGRLCVTPAPRRKAQAAWHQSPNPADVWHSRELPCWSWGFKSDRWQHGHNSELGPTLRLEAL